MTAKDDTKKPTGTSAGGSKPLGLSGGTLGLKRPVNLGGRGAGKGTVTVEVKRKRSVLQQQKGAGLKPVFTPADTALQKKTLEPAAGVDELANLTPSERATRLKALQQATPKSEVAADEELRILKKVDTDQPAEAVPEDALDDVVEETPVVVEPIVEEKPAAPVDNTPLKKLMRVDANDRAAGAAASDADDADQAAAAANLNLVPDAAAQAMAAAAKQMSGDTTATPATTTAAKPSAPTTARRRVADDTPLRRIVRRDQVDLSDKVAAATKARAAAAQEEEVAETRRRNLKAAPAAPGAKKPDNNKSNARIEPRRQRRLTLTDVMSGTADSERTHSLASARRRQQKVNRKSGPTIQRDKVMREVILPDTITVQELANRMTEQTSNVVKELMKLGIMATATQSIDSDTAELVIEELGHSFKRVAETAIEDSIVGDADDEADLQPRPPVVTIMGHVDHGKTSLLDALRKGAKDKTGDVAGKEAGGITQHIGAYQIEPKKGQKISFVDTPGHAAFTEMRARGANVTDIVILVVAADDSIMPQTVEAINHAKAAEVPIIVAINKMDVEGANPDKVRTDLLTHELIPEEMGGDIMCVEVSAKQGKNLDKLLDAILLQAEVLELKANPNRSAEAVVVESQLDIGRGSVATVLIKRGTLKVGDIFVVGTEWGRVRALVADGGKKVKEAIPAMPVEVLGLNGTPKAGDTFVVVESEARAREVSDFRSAKIREQEAAAMRQTSVEAMFANAASGKKLLSLVVKTDVHGSLEAINASMEKAGNDEVGVRVIHSGVGSITESDIVLAKASDALVIGFNVRANPQAREAAKRDGIDVRYHSIIYNVIDDVNNVLTGMLAPTYQEDFLGYATIKQVFDVSKVGKVAGCIVTEGVIKRGCKVRLLRDNVVIHEGTLKTLKRHKEEVKEVRNGLECGMAFEKYEDIREEDQIECFELQEKAASLEN